MKLCAFITRVKSPHLRGVRQLKVYLSQKTLSSFFCKVGHKHFGQSSSDEQSNQANEKEYEASSSMLHWCRPECFSETALEYHHHNNISKQRGVRVNKGNIWFTSQQSH